MSIEALFDHALQVWRPTESAGSGGAVDQSFTPIPGPDGPALAIVPPRWNVENIGPGETERGKAQWFADRRLDVAERDVIQLLGGPEAPGTYRVVSVARPRDHHLELVVEPWVGRLPDPDGPEEGS